MLNTPIDAAGVCLFSPTFLYVRVAGTMIQIVTTEGTVHVVCDRPRFLLRDLQAGLIADFAAGVQLGQPPADYTIESATVSTRRETPTPGLAVLPDSLPVPGGAVLLETKSTAEYHAYNSLQIVGVTRHGRLIVGFAATSYQLIFPEGTNLAQLYREAVKGDLVNDHIAHFTTLPDESYVNCLPVRRYRCQEISLVQQHTDCWGGLELLADFRKDPAHAALMAKVVEKTKAKARGMDI